MSGPGSPLMGHDMQLEAVTCTQTGVDSENMDGGGHK